MSNNNTNPSDSGEAELKFINKAPEDNEWSAHIRLLNEYTSPGRYLRTIIQYARSGPFYPADMHTDLIEQYIVARNAGTTPSDAELKGIVDGLYCFGLLDARPDYYRPNGTELKRHEALALLVAREANLKANWESITPKPTDELCYDCGQKMFWYDQAYRCIYCGFHNQYALKQETEKLTMPQRLEGEHNGSNK